MRSEDLFNAVGLMKRRAEMERSWINGQDEKLSEIEGRLRQLNGLFVEALMINQKKFIPILCQFVDTTPEEDFDTLMQFMKHGFMSLGISYFKTHLLYMDEQSVNPGAKLKLQRWLWQYEAKI